ncbi:MAG: cyclic pyranopterin monophosphate synthase MoaC [Deltaproteobacteria bacterium]|jgi:cyclic pyranopterin phosphate synthase|nr:cyclic pyranopterin monophosphate synthase MoaC [Deltaproteobacteria bacterium]
MPVPSFSHIKDDGSAVMVDVGGKDISSRRAVAGASVVLNAHTFELLRHKALPKGDALAVAKTAGIMAAKQTAALIPLCHSLALDFVDLSFELEEKTHSVHIRAEVRLAARTGVEMEALCAVQIAALTIYDMCKAAQKDIKITNCRLLHKSGGRSGTYDAEG